MGVCEVDAVPYRGTSLLGSAVLKSGLVVSLPGSETREQDAHEVRPLLNCVLDARTSERANGPAIIVVPMISLSCPTYLNDMLLGLPGSTQFSAQRAHGPG